MAPFTCPPRNLAISASGARDWISPLPSRRTNVCMCGVFGPGHRRTGQDDDVPRRLGRRLAGLGSRSGPLGPKILHVRDLTRIIWPRLFRPGPGFPRGSSAFVSASILPLPGLGHRRTGRDDVSDAGCWCNRCCKTSPVDLDGFQDLQGGFCQQKHHHRNADPKIGPRGVGKPARNQRKTTKTPENQQKLRDPVPT